MGTFYMNISVELIKKAETCVRLLHNKKIQIAFAESCTGGLLSYLFAAVPGASSVLECSLVTYSNSAKTDFLDVPEEYIKNYGAVSKEVAARMAEGIIKARKRVEMAISITGIAGHAKHMHDTTNEEGVGTVFIGYARRDDKTEIFPFQFGNLTRHEIQHKTAEKALGIILQEASKG
ncbi:Nicotinamide-nucleotide amidohydrolase PncC [Anaplasma phagocytophilum]|nr:Nicotinamide-nucleotide amidohydrolase PncC [Anaplasma phagocytophilum]